MAADVPDDAEVPDGRADGSDTDEPGEDAFDTDEPGEDAFDTDEPGEDAFDTDEPGEDAFDEGAARYRAPLPPDDRLWRHPSELGRPVPVSAAPASPSRRLTWATTLVSGTVGAALAVAGVTLAGGFDDDPPRQQTVIRETVRNAVAPADLDIRAGSVVDIAARARPAITRIAVSSSTADSTGSGVLFRDDGHLITNAHVVRGAEVITVVLSDGEELAGELVGIDDLTDVAVVKVGRDRPFATAALGSAVDLRVGQPLVAIGSPLGLSGGPSVTTGVVSALGREVRSEDGTALLDMIQTDAPIAPGSSGGALLDASGSVVGITTAIAAGDDGPGGLGFAVPIDVAGSVAEEIIATGHAVHVWIGVRGEDIDRATADELGVHGGAFVTEVIDDSPAGRVGVERGDVIMSLDHRAVSSMAGLVVLLRRQDPGVQVELSWVRDGVRMTAVVDLEERPGDY